MSQVDTMKTAGQAPVLPEGEFEVRLRSLPETLELARMLEAGWADQLAILHASCLPLNAGDADDAGGDDDGDDGDGAADGDDGGGKDEPKTFDATYVKKLRTENAAARKRAQEAETRAKELEDRDKSDQQKLAEKAEADAKRADEAEAKLLRADVAADKGVPAKLAKFLTGSTKAELEKAADELLAELKDNGNGRSSFDGGPRDTPPPAGDLDSAIRRAGGRT